LAVWYRNTCFPSSRNSTPVEVSLRLTCCARLPEKSDKENKNRRRILLKHIRNSG